jgi:hypothetical protein
MMARADASRVASGGARRARRLGGNTSTGPRIFRLRTGPSSVPKSEDYRRHASECLRLAQATEDLDSKALLLEMAQAWITLAAQMETRGERKLYDMANVPVLNFDGFVRDFNDAQMTKH